MSHSNLRHSAEAAKLAGEAIKELPKLPQKKSPVAAAIIGGLFGAAGAGLYLQSWLDFFVCLAAFVFLLICIPGLGALPGWLFAGAYGYYRVSTSNAKHP